MICIYNLYAHTQTHTDTQTDTYTTLIVYTLCICNRYAKHDICTLFPNVKYPHHCDKYCQTNCQNDGSYILHLLIITCACEFGILGPISTLISEYVTISESYN